jgi:glycosyltransferase involved in cell wall biosynthesis
MVALAGHQREQGHEVAVAAFTPTEPGYERVIDETRRQGIEWIVPERNTRKLARLLWTRRFIARYRPDAILAHTTVAAQFCRAACKLLWSRPAVIYVLQDRGPRGFWESIEKRLFRSTACLVAVSPWQLDDYRQRIGRPPDAEVIYNSIDARVVIEAARHRDAARKRLGLTRDDRLILQVGRVQQVKQPHLSVKAVAPIASTSPSLKFWLAGNLVSGAYVDRVRAEIDAFGLHDRITLLGPRSDVPELLAAGDVYLMPSEWEGFSLGMLEALASGIAVVASDIPMFEFARSLEGVRIVDPTDTHAFTRAIQTLLDQNRRYPRDLHEFSIDFAADRYRQVIERVLEHRRRR